MNSVYDMNTVFIFKIALVIPINKVRVVKLVATEVEASSVEINFTFSEPAAKLYSN